MYTQAGDAQEGHGGQAGDEEEGEGLGVRDGVDAAAQIAPGFLVGLLLCVFYVCNSSIYDYMYIHANVKQHRGVHVYIQSPEDPHGEPVQGVQGGEGQVQGHAHKGGPHVPHQPVAEGCGGWWLFSVCVCW